MREDLGSQGALWMDRPEYNFLRKMYPLAVLAVPEELLDGELDDDDGTIELVADDVALIWVSNLRLRPRNLAPTFILETWNK